MGARELFTPHPLVEVSMQGEKAVPVTRIPISGFKSVTIHVVIRKKRLHSTTKQAGIEKLLDYRKTMGMPQQEMPLRFRQSHP